MKHIRLWSILLLFSTLLQFGAGAIPAFAAEDELQHTHTEEEHSHAPSTLTDFPDLQSYLPGSTTSSVSSQSLAGDMDNDGDVDVADAIYLLRHVLKPKDYPITKAADMDGDEDIDVADAVYLLRHTLMPGKYPLQVHSHTVVAQLAVAATCTRSGLTAGSYCSDCGEILEAQRVTPPTGHNARVVEEIAAGCTKDGYVKEHCSVCNTDFLSQLTYAMGHDYGEAEIETEATCTEEGLARYTCRECGHSETVALSAKGHSLVATDADTDGAVIYLCADCGLTTKDSSTTDPSEEEHLFHCDESFCFDILYNGDEAYIREHLSISDAYYTSPTPEEQIDYELTYRGEGVWTVSPTVAYEGGNTYRATVSGDLQFAEHNTKELYFTVADEIHSDIALSDGIIFLPLPAIGTVERQRYKLETNTDNEYFYLTMPDNGLFTEAQIGRIICAGAYTDMDEFLADSSKECYFGKIDKIYTTADGNILLVLSCPELYEIYTELDIYEHYTVELSEALLPEDLEAQAISALRSSDDFGEFLTGIAVASRSYADSHGVVAVGVADLSFLDDLGLIPTFKIENGSILTVAIQGKLPIQLKNADGQKYGTVTISFTAKASFSFSVSGVCELTYFWGIPTGVKEFDFSVTQTSTYTLEFSVKVALEPIPGEKSKSVVRSAAGVYHLKDCVAVSIFPAGSLTAVSNDQMDKLFREKDGQIDAVCGICNPVMSYLKKEVYVINTDTKTVHRFLCTEADRMEATNTATSDSAPLIGYTHCGCLYGQTDEEKTFEEMLVDSLRYQNWSEIATKVKAMLSKDGKPAEKESQFQLLNLPVRFAGIFQVTLEAKMVIGFKFSGSVTLSYQNTVTTVTGVRLNASSTLEPYSSRTVTERTVNFQVAGGLDVKAGIRFDVKAGLAGFLGKYVYISIGFEGGTYSDLDGIFFVESTTTDKDGESSTDTSVFAAAYWEMGLYGDVFFEYKVAFWGNKYSLLGGDKRLPLVAFGYDKVYYNYSSTVESIEATGKQVDLKGYSILVVNAFDVKKLTSSLETLSILGVSGEYEVIITILDENGNPSPYCSLQNGVIVISENAPCDLTVTVVFTVKGKGNGVDTVVDFFQNGYTVGDDLYKLPEYRLTLKVTNHTMCDWEVLEEPTCTEEGKKWRYSTCDCSDTEYLSIPALGHLSVTDPAYAATCTEDGATEGSHCGRCEEVLIAQIPLPAFGHAYADAFTCHDRPCQNSGCTHVEKATTEHRYSDWIDVPMDGCALEAYQIRYCLDCRFTATDKTDLDPSHMHDVGIPETVYPTCTEDGYILCLCNRCGKELINDVLPKTGHRLGDYIIEGNTHYQKCQNRGCYYTTEAEEHTFDHACDTDCNACGFTRVTTHTWASEYSHSASAHWYECEICGADGEKESHRYLKNCKICDDCGYESTASHAWSDEYYSDAQGHFKVCTACGEKGKPEAHTYHTDCTACDTCQRNSGNQHSWSEQYSQNGSAHWFECQSCQQIRSKENHAFSLHEPIYPATSATCQVAATYYYYCECGKVGNTTFSYGEKADHRFGASYVADGERHYRICQYGCKTVTDEEAHRFGAYQTVKPATCTAVGKETRSCSLCQATDSREIPMVAHSYKDSYDYDSIRHFIACKACGDRIQEGVHRMGDDLICDDCGYETTAEHDWDPVYRYDGEQHWTVCRDCGITKGEAAHRFENGCDTDCSVCGYTRQTEHRWSEDYVQAADSHYIVCYECGEKKAEGAHLYDHACDTDCNICGKVRKTTHQLSKTYENDEGGHWRICTVCGEAESKSAHSGGVATCTDAPICTVCQTGYGSAKGHDFSGSILYNDTHHYQICQNGCGSESEYQPHTYGAYQQLLAPTCTKEGRAVRYCTGCQKSEEQAIPMIDHSFGEAWKNDSDGHWHECSACSLDGEKLPHEYDNACDTDCNVCGKKRTVTHQWESEYAYDTDRHWKVCKICSYTEGAAAHSFDNACDTDCGDCGYTRTTRHDWSSKYSADGDSHWYECRSCRARQGEGAHGGGMATCTQRAICAICQNEYGTTTAHSYVMRVETSAYLQKAATCEGEGIYYYSCVCGKRGDTTFTVAALGHDWKETYTKDATHHWLDCTRCTKTDGKSAHTGGEATCLEKAVCIACGSAYGVYAAHDYSVKSGEYPASKATCESPAYYYYTCSMCDAKGSTTYAVGLSLGHRFADQYTVTANSHYFSCLNGCGKRLSEGSHTYGAYVETVAPTCTAKGEEAHSCTACGHSESRPLDMIPHEMSDQEEVVTEIIPQNGGYLYVHKIVFGCIHCDYYEVQATSTEHIHEDVDYILGMPATCTEDGLTSGVICAVAGCGEVRVAQEVIPALGHDYLLGICTRCGEEEVFYSKGLTYTLSSDKTYYIVTGMGTCTDTEIVIPATYQGLPVKEIGGGAFAYNTKITSVEIPDGVTLISSHAFEGCYNLLFVSMPDTVTTIGSDAFSSCTQLAEITLPRDLKILGDDAFNVCVMLRTIYFNAVQMDDLSLTGTNENYIIVGNDAFSRAGSASGGITVIIGKDVTKVPAYLFYSHTDRTYAPTIAKVTFEEGSVCREIGDNAFRQVKGLVSIKLPDTVTSIGNSAFDRTDLKSVQFGKGLKTIGYWAFGDCVNLSWAELPEGCTSIGNSAFSGCTALWSVTLPASLQTLGNSAFYNCTGLSEIHYNATQMADLSPDNFIFANAGINGNGIAVTVGAGVKRIPAYLFSPYYMDFSPKITSVVFAEDSQCREIGTGAFAYCDDLTEITILASVEIIRTYAFRSCTGLATIYYNGKQSQWNSVTKESYWDYGSAYTLICLVGDGSNGLTYALSSDGSYYTVTGMGSCTDTELVIPATYRGLPVKEIGDWAFSNNAQIISVEIRDGVTVIGQYAFDGCYNLLSVSVPNSLTAVGSFAFQSCTSLLSITLPENLQTLGYAAFYQCSSLEKVYFNAIAMSDLQADNFVFGSVGVSGNGVAIIVGTQVTRIPNYLFSNKGASIRSVAFESGSRCTYIGEGSFEKCGDLTQIVLPDSVTEIGAYAFWSCIGLKSITLPENLKTVGMFAFAYCAQLTNLYFNAIEMEDVLDIEDAYYFMESGSESGGYTVTVGSKVKRIPAMLFARYSYENYANIYVNKLVFASGCVCESIGASAFESCIYLSSVTFPGSLKRIELGAFAYCTALTAVSLPSGLTDLGEYAFGGCSSLSTLTLGSSLKSIQEGTFEYCTSITGVSIPNTVEFIGYGAFYCCESLRTLSIGSKVSYIETGAFYGCVRLTSINIPNSVKSIGDYAFGDCYGLKTVTLGSGVTYLGWAAFGGCTGMQSVIFTGNAPTIDDQAFLDVAAKVYYPKNNSTWTAAKRQSYGGTLTWVAS